MGIEGNEGPPASHEEVLEAVNTRSEQMQALVKAIVEELNTSGALNSMPELSEINLNASPCNKRKWTVCPYSLLTSIPLHCWTMGLAAVALGATVCKRKI